MKRFKLPQAATIAGIVVLSVIFIGQRILLNKSFSDKPIRIVVDRNVPLVSMIAGDEETIGKIKKGDTVDYLGVVAGTRHHPYGLLVQTKEGERGLLAAAEMGFPMMMENGSDSQPVQVKSLFRDKGKNKGAKGTLYYNIVNARGEKKKVHLDEVRPVLPDSLSKKRLDKEGDYYMTKAKFERLYIGHKLAENDARYRPAWLIDKTKKGFLAYYPNIEVIDSDGKFRNPMVVYGADSVAVTYAFEDSHAKGNNRWIVKWMPLLGTIVDVDFFAAMIESSMRYDWIHGDDENYSAKAEIEWGDIPILSYVGLFFWIVLGLIWIFVGFTLVTLLMEAALYWRFTYYHLPDNIVAILFAVVAVVVTYIWTALMAVWGCLWLFLPVIPFAGYCAYLYSVRMLSTAPHTRCPDCKRMETIEFHSRTFQREYDEWRPESKAISSHTERWKTWTDVTTKWSDGSTTHRREDERNHSRTTTQYADYSVLYHVRLYHRNYYCPECGYKEYKPEEELTELQRHYRGQHTSVTES